MTGSISPNLKPGSTSGRPSLWTAERENLHLIILSDMEAGSNKADGADNRAGLGARGGCEQGKDVVPSCCGVRRLRSVEQEFLFPTELTT